MTNITTFEDRRSNSIISNKLNSEKFTLPKLIEYSNSKNISKNIKNGAINSSDFLNLLYKTI